MASFSGSLQAQEDRLQLKIIFSKSSIIVFGGKSYMRRTISKLGLTAGAVLVLAACAGGGEDDEPEESGFQENGDELTTVSLGVLPIVDVAAAYLGVEEGFFEEVGIDLQIETMQTGPTAVASIVSGELDVGYSAVSSILLSNAAGMEMQILTSGNFSTGEPGDDTGGIVASPESDISEMADLEGQSVAVNTLGNIAEVTLQVSLEDAGVDPDNVEYVEMPFSEMPAALELGNVDAAWVVEPFLTIVVDQGSTLVTSNMVDAGQGENLIVGAYYTSHEFVNENPDLASAFVQAMDRSLEFASDNPNGVRTVLQSYTEIAPDVIERLTLPLFVSGQDEAAVAHVAELTVAAGIIDDDDVSSLFPED